MKPPNPGIPATCGDAPQSVGVIDSAVFENLDGVKPGSSDGIATGATERVGVDLAREMRRRWHEGQRVAAEELLAARPQLWERPEAAVELIYEEYCLRQ